MMKTNRSRMIIALLLAIITVFTAFAVVGCKGNSDTLETGTDTETVDKSDVETSVGTTAESSKETSKETSKQTSEDTTKDTEPETTKEIVVLPDGMLFDNRKTGHVIVSKRSSAINSAVEALKKALKDNCNIEMESIGENYYKTLYPDMSGNKVVVGQIDNDPVAVELYESLLTTNSYIIKFVNNSLYIIGGSGEATEAAVQYFIKTYLIKYYTYTLTLEEGVLYEQNTPPAAEGLTIASNPIENYVIVHDGSTVGARRAKELRSMIAEKTGEDIKVVAPTADPVEHEILIGKVDRPEVSAIRAEYDRPNVYYDVKVVGNKLVCVGEGWYTMGKIVTALGEYLENIDPEDLNLSGEVLSGDMINEIDTTDMLNRAEGTDVRVFNYNTYGTVYNYTQYPLFAGEHERGEVIGDIILAYFPDVITTNEFYVNSALFKAAMTQLSDYYMLIDTSDYDAGYPYPGVTGNVGRGNPEQILIKKSCNFKIVDSGWRYLGETDGSILDFHGIHWAVLETQAGEKFIITVGHYGDSNSYNGYAKEHQEAIKMAQACSGSEEILPTVASGDFFSSSTSGAAYKYHLSCGFSDPQRIKEINRNITERGDININQATSHSFGKSAGDGTKIDFILHNSAFTPLKFKVLKSEELNYTSDHYPEVVDLKFT